MKFKIGLITIAGLLIATLQSCVVRVNGAHPHRHRGHIIVVDQDSTNVNDGMSKTVVTDSVQIVGGK